MKGTHQTLRVVVVTSMALGIYWFVACARIPVIYPSQDRSSCDDLFVKRPFQVVHTIQAILPQQAVTGLIGISIVDPNARRFRSVLTSLEGLTLFDATQTADGLVVHRALPPLDKEGFGAGLVADVALMLLAPVDDLVQTGVNAQGQQICRYGQGRRKVDLVRQSADQAMIRLYQDQKLTRQVTVYRKGQPMAQQMILHATEGVEYQLEMNLQELSWMEVSDQRFSPR